MVTSTFRRRTTGNASKPKLSASLDVDDDAYKFDPGVCFAQKHTWDIKTPPNGPRKRFAGKRSSDDMDPLSKAQCLRNDAAKRQVRPVSRRGLPDQSWINNKNDNHGKRFKRDNSNRFRSVAHATLHQDEHQGPAISKDYTIPKKGAVNTEGFLKLAREKTHESTGSSPHKNGFARHVSEGLRRSRQQGMVDLSEENDSIIPISSTTNHDGKEHVRIDDDAGGCGDDSNDSVGGYDTQESNSSIGGSKSNKSHDQRGIIHSDRAVCSSPSKTGEDDDICEVIQVEVAPSAKHEQVKTLGSNPSRRTRAGKMQLKTPQQSTIRGLFDSVRRASHNLLSPEPQVQGICRSLSDEGKVENVLAMVKSEPVRTEAPALSTAERALRQFTTPKLATSSNRRSIQPLKLSKANGRKAFGKPLDRTTTRGNGTSVFDFFQKSERKTEVESDHVKIKSELRSEPRCSQDSQQSKRRRSSRLKTSSENPIEIEDSDDDVGSTRSLLDQRSPRLLDTSIDLARLSVGSYYCHTECKLILKGDRLTLCYNIKKQRRERITKARHVIDLDDVRQFHHFVSGGEDMVLAILRIDPTESNGFNKVSKYLRAIDGEEDKQYIPKKGYIVLEFRSKGALQHLLEWMREHPSLKPFLEGPGATLASLDECKEYAATMLDNIQREQKDREDSISAPWTRSKRRGSKDTDTESNSKEIFLVFPFDTAESNIDAAAESLTEANRVVEQAAVTRSIGRAESSDSENNGGPVRQAHFEANRKVGDKVTTIDAKDQGILSDSDAGIEASAGAGITDETKKKVRAHYLTIRKEDVDRLEPGEFLNDTLIDFWMEWLMRKEDRQSSPLHIFSSHFYTTLSEEGTEAVESWTARKNIDIFSKRFIFLPINKSLHWSLCVVVNPLYIMNASCEIDVGIDGDTEYQPFPCILFLDSLKAHRKDLVARHVRKWLNAEWKRLMAPQYGGVNPFSPSTMPVFTPRIPYQDNCCDCGVFVCRYAYALFMLRNNAVTIAGGANPSEALKDAITDRDEFQFDMQDIERIRLEMKVLISRLSTRYRDEKATLHAEESVSVVDRNSTKENDAPVSPAGEGNGAVILCRGEEMLDGGDVRTAFEARIKQEKMDGIAFI